MCKKGHTPWNKGISTKALGKARPKKIGICAECKKEFYPRWHKSKYHGSCWKIVLYKINKDKLGLKNAQWKDNKAGYSAIHYWVQRQKGKAKYCVECGSSKKCVWANISGLYLRDVNDYKSLCYSCHALFDRKKGLGDAKKQFKNYQQRIIN